MSEMSS
jgi:hypothetical protein